MKFHPYEPLDNNSAQRRVWDVLKKAFKDDEGVAYYRYPIFSRSGKLNREPDILMMHRALGLWVVEVKGYCIANISSIQGHNWLMNAWCKEYETPIAQVEDAMFAIRSKFEERRETRGLVSFHFQLALPFIQFQDWKAKGFDDLPTAQGVVLFNEALTPAALKREIQERATNFPQRSLTDEQWETVLAVLGGTLPAKEPRAIPTGTTVENPIRIIHDLESRFKFLDEQQQKVAFEVPSGPQRIRGLAGTGKTVLFAKRVAKMHAGHPDWQIAFVFFTRALYDQILELIGLFYREMTNEEPDWLKINVLHAWGAKERNGFYRNLALRSGKRPMSVRDVDREVGGSISPSQAFEYICDKLERDVSELPILYDAILIDEGQDLPPSFYRLARRTLSDPRRLYWAYDEAQGIGSLIVPRAKVIFGENPDKTPVVDLSGFYSNGIRKAHNLNRCYRTPRMLLMAAHAVNMGIFREGGPLQGVTDKSEWAKLGYTVEEGDFRAIGKLIKITRKAGDSPHPIDQEDFGLKDALGSPLSMHTFSTEAEEQNWIADQVADDLKLGFDPWDLMITGPTGDREKQYYEALKEALRQRGVKSLIAGVDTEQDIFRMDGYVTIAPIFRAKGNEAWRVYACRFQYATQPLPFKRDEKEIHKRNEAFVAITRARVWCVVTGIESPIFDELRTAKEQHPYLIFPSFNRSSIERNNDEQEQNDNEAEAS